MGLFWTTVGAVVVGGIITLGVSWFFYRKASRDLAAQANGISSQADRIKKQVDKVLEGLEEAGLIQLTRKNGEIRGLVKNAEVRIVSITQMDVDPQQDQTERGIPETD